MFFGNYKSHAVPFFISSNLLPLDLLYFKSVAILMHDVFNNLSPPQITNIFNFQSNIHPHNTRLSSRGNFSVQYSRLEKRNRSFSWVGVKVWNSLPVEMRHTPKTNFKRKIHCLILQKFSEVDDYIDQPDLIKNWKYLVNSVYYICIIHNSSCSCQYYLTYFYILTYIDIDIYIYIFSPTMAMFT